MGDTYLLFVSRPTGYELKEAHGEPPELGAEVEEDGLRLRVTKIATSPLPGDARVAVYTQEA